MSKKEYMPVTPAGTLLTWLIADTEQGAWDNLLEDAAHMPYKTQENFVIRGYTVILLED